MNCGVRFAKCVLIFFNVIIFLGGGAVLGVGIWLKVNFSSFLEMLRVVDPSNLAVETTKDWMGNGQMYFDIIAYLLIAAGAFAFLVGFLGCCGACQEWRPLLVIYAIFLMIILIAEIGVGIFVGTQRHDLLKRVESQFGDDVFVPNYRFVETELLNDTNKLNVRFANFTDDGQRMITTLGNTFQVLIGCCGLRKAGEIPAYQVFLNDNATYRKDLLAAGRSPQPPVFCCQFTDWKSLNLVQKECASTTPMVREGLINQEGCFDKIETFVDRYAPVIIGVAVGIGLVELIGVFFAFCVCCAIGDELKYR